MFESKSLSNRLCVFRISETTVFDWFVNAAIRDGNSARFIHVPVLNGLPDDVKVHSVRHEPRDRCFAFLLESEMFPETLPGDMIPDLQGLFRLEYRKVDLEPVKPTCDDNPVVQLAIDDLNGEGDALMEFFRS